MRMIKNNFERIRRALAMAMRKRNAGFIVQVLDHTAALLTFGTEVIHRKRTRSVFGRSQARLGWVDV